MVTPIASSLVGSFSTEREALDACREKQPDLLYVTEQTDFAKGTTSIRALHSIDIAVRHAELVAAMQDAIA